MISRKVVVANKPGLCVELWADIVRCAKEFESYVSIEIDRKRVSAKKILELLQLRIRPGATVIMRARGRDENNALDTVCRLIEQGSASIDEEKR